MSVWLHLHKDSFIKSCFSQFKRPVQILDLFHRLKKILKCTVVDLAKVLVICYHITKGSGERFSCLHTFGYIVYFKYVNLPLTVLPPFTFK